MVRRHAEAIPPRVARMGGPVQVTDVPARRLSWADALRTYRGGWCGERRFHRLKDEPLGIRPSSVRRDDPIRGSTPLVTRAPRGLMRFEVLVRRGQPASGEERKGLDPGPAKRVTDRPTAQRVLAAISRAEMTPARMVSGGEVRWHLETLPVLVKQVLGYQGLSEAVDTRLAINSS
jgi:hypothetical protein